MQVSGFGGEAFGRGASLRLIAKPSLCTDPRRFASGSACSLPVRRFCCGFAAQRFVRILTTSSFTPFAPSKGQPERRRPCCGGKAFGLGASLRLIAKPSLCTDPRRFASGSACLYLYDSFCYGFAAQRFVRLPTTFMLCLPREATLTNGPPIGWRPSAGGCSFA